MPPSLTAPWILSAEKDPDYSDDQRRRNHRMLTDAELLAWGARHDYDETIRALELVWECPDDGLVNVTGFRCCRCSSGRARG